MLGINKDIIHPCWMTWHEIVISKSFRICMLHFPIKIKHWPRAFESWLFLIITWKITVYFPFSIEMFQFMYLLSHIEIMGLGCNKFEKLRFIWIWILCDRAKFNGAQVSISRVSGVRRRRRRNSTTWRTPRSWPCTAWTCTPPRTRRTSTSRWGSAPRACSSTGRSEWSQNLIEELLVVWTWFTVIFTKSNLLTFLIGRWSGCASTGSRGPRSWRSATSGTTSTWSCARASSSSSSPRWASNWPTTAPPRNSGRPASSTTPSSGFWY